jgi:hypothetical protein
VPVREDEATRQERARADAVIGQDEHDGWRNALINLCFLGAANGEGFSLVDLEERRLRLRAMSHRGLGAAHIHLRQLASCGPVALRDAITHALEAFLREGGGGEKGAGQTHCQEELVHPLRPLPHDHKMLWSFSIFLDHIEIIS